MKQKQSAKWIGAILSALLLLTAVPVTAAFTETTVSAATVTTSNFESQVKSIVKNNVKSGDSKKTKLKKLFKYMEKTYGYQRQMDFKNTKGWTKTYAIEMLNSKNGSCYHYAALYAYLIKQATGYTVRVAIGETNGFSGSYQSHAWVEVKIDSKWYICDPNLDQFGANSSLKYYLKAKTSSAMKKTYKAKSYVNITL
jgi:transglutaminase-like putative cysteine protease